MWCGVLWCGVLWCGVKWSSVVCCCMVWCHTTPQWKVYLWAHCRCSYKFWISCISDRLLTNRDLPNMTLEYSNKEHFYLALSVAKPISFERRFYATVILHWIYHETPDFFSYLQGRQSAVKTTSATSEASIVNDQRGL